MDLALWALVAAILALAAAVMCVVWVILERSRSPRELTEEEIAANVAPVVPPMYVFTNGSDRGRTP